MLVRFIGKIVDAFMQARNKYLTYRNTAIIHNEGSSAGADCCFVHPENIYIGKNSYINGGHIMASPNAKITIGDDCLISYQVHMRTDMHAYSDSSTLIRNQGFIEKDITIGNDVWIGYGAQIMSGVTVADGCVIGASAVVTHDTVPYGVYGGVPAKLIKTRTHTNEQ